MDQSRDELLFSDVKGKNPFKDPKVREAVVLAVDTKIINDKIMRRGCRWARWSPPRSTAMTSPTARRTSRIPSAPRSCWPRPAIPRASVTMDCPNDRYVNDEKICCAVAGMLTRVGIKVNLLAQTKSKYFGKILLQAGNQTSMYMLG